MDLKSLVFTLCGENGVSGNEVRAAEAAKNALAPFVEETAIQPRGSVTGRMRGQGPLIVLDAHIDQIGLIVTGIEEGGFVRFDQCGGVDIRTLGGLEVRIHGKEDIYGIVSTVPPHLSSASDRDKAKPCTELAIDTGYSKESLENLVSLGDRVSFVSYPASMLGEQITAGALDDRAGVAALIRTAELLNSADIRPNVLFTFSVQEEVGGQGAATAVTKNTLTKEETPDLAIAVDVSFAKSPGCSPRDCGILGKGPMIGYSPLLSKDVFETLKKTAEDNDIAYQLEIMNGRTGTHADELAVSHGGLMTGIVSIPLKYMHTPSEVVDLNDLEATAQLLANYILQKGGATA